MSKWLKLSKENKQKIMIFYIDRHHNITQRIIRVIDIQDDTIVAFCYYRKQVRTFQTNNILSVGSLSKRVGA